jgi:hypothetical protein
MYFHKAARLHFASRVSADCRAVSSLPIPTIMIVCQPVIRFVIDFHAADNGCLDYISVTFQLSSDTVY